MSDFEALIVDYGGVLTNPLQSTLTAWCEGDRVDVTTFHQAMHALLGDAADDNPVHALERGQLGIPHFEELLAARLRTHDGDPVPAAGLLQRMFAGFRHDHRMLDALRAARQGGVRTALLSNSWGLDYPRAGWDKLFDAVVISGEVGLRKPEPAIYLLAASRLGVAPERCVFVDDLAPNVRGAVEVGMCGVHHTDPETTLAALAALGIAGEAGTHRRRHCGD